MNISNLPIANPDIHIQEACSHFTHQILSSGTEGDQVLMQAENYPDCVLIQSFAAAYYLFGQTQETTLAAKKHLQQADKHLNQAHFREKMWYQAMLAWSHQDYELAITLLMAIAKQWPKDLLAIKLIEWLNYCSGQVFTAKNMLKFCHELADKNKDNSHFLAIYAFAHELNNDFDKAYHIANQAVELEYNTPWAHHALGHYYLRTGQLNKGLKALEGFKPSWENILLLLREHNTWHLALHYLANMDETKVLELFNEDIWCHWPSSVIEQIDAISLLWRMDMAGMNTQSKWQEIVGYMDRYSHDHYMPFNNLHHLYALVRAGQEQEANDALVTLRKYAKENNTINDRRWLQVALPAFEGIIAFAKQEYSMACSLISPIVNDIFIVGGSDAQDEIFIQSLMIAALKSKQKKIAEQTMDTYLSHYKKSKLAEYWNTLSR